MFQRLRLSVKFSALVLLFAIPAIALAAEVPTSALLGQLHWRSVGPYVGGRVISVAGVANQPKLYYMGAVGGGVWKSKNYGHSWKNISDKYFNSNNIGAIAVAPSNPKIIYVGTGESDIRNQFLTGDGMYKSTDGGKTWKHIGLAKTETISWILVDPTNPDVVYVASMGHVWAPNPQRGVYKSTDGGQTWKKILYVNDKTGAITMAMDPSNSKVIYATMWQAYRRPWTFSSGGPGSGIYKSTDGGENWTNITHNQGLPSGIFGKVGIAVAPSSPNVVYALIQAKYKPGHPGGLFRSTDGGNTWQIMNDSPDITQRAFYYMRVYVDPTDPNTIYLPNVDVFVSHNGGKKLERLHPPHGDNHAFWINPDNPKIFIEGNDGGATVTRDGGKTWSTEHNQPTAQIYHANLDHQFPFHIYGAQQDEGAWMGWSAVRHGKIPPVWERAAGGESTWSVPQPGKWWITYGTGYFSLMNKYNRRTGVNQSIDPSPIYHNGAPASELKFRGAWIHHPVMFLPHNHHVLLDGMQYVLKSTDFGHSWTKISPDLTRHDQSKEKLPGGPISHDISGAEIYDTISAMAVSPTNDDVIWVGSDDGLVHVTQDGGSSWSDVTPSGLPKWIKISCIDASGANPGTAYLTASRYEWNDFKPYIYVTHDYGKQWTSLSNGLPSHQYLESVRQDPNDPGLLFVATSKTVYMSLDGGHHWQPLTLNLPPVRVMDIEIQPEQHAVVLATHGRGFWVLDNLKFLEQLGNAQVASNQPYLFAPQQTWLVKRTMGGFRGSQVGGKNLPAVANVFYYLPKSYQAGAPVELSFTTTDGKVIRRFKLPYVEQEPNGLRNKKAKQKREKAAKLHSGMNHFAWNFRYQHAPYVHGFFVAEHGVDTIVGPTIVPGTYDVVLKYHGKTLTQPFQVKLDPRLKTTQGQMQARFALQMKINQTLTHLNTTINKALDARSRLDKAMASGGVNGSQAKDLKTSLDQDIDKMVNLKIQSSEGDLVFETRVTERLAMLQLQIDRSFTPLRPPEQKGYSILSGKAGSGEAQLNKDINAADALVGGSGN